MFVGLLGLHIALHWRQVVSLFGRWVNSRQLRWVLGLGFGGVCLALLLVPLFAPIDVRAAAGHGRRRATLAELEEQTGCASRLHHGAASSRVSALEIEGWMTLREVAHTYDVPIEHLAAQLGLPADTPYDTRLGLLRKRYGFRMSDVRRAVVAYRSER